MLVKCLLQVGEFLTREDRPSGKREAANDAPLRDQRLEGLKRGLGEDGGHVAELEGDTEVGLVAAVAVHRVPKIGRAHV